MDLIGQHHRDQNLIVRSLVEGLVPLWEILRFEDLDRNTSQWLKATRPLIARAHLQSQRVSSVFAQRYKSETLPGSDLLPVALMDVEMPVGLDPLAWWPMDAPRLEVKAFEDVRAMTSMLVTGPVRVKKLMPMSETEAMLRGLSASSGAAIRLAINGGRGVIRFLADVDADAVGMIAVPEFGSCDDCADLGKAPTSEPARMNRMAVGHDFCACTSHLVYP